MGARCKLVRPPLARYSSLVDPLVLSLTPRAARARHSSFAEAALTALLTVPAKPRRLDRNIPRKTRMSGSECASRPPEPPTGSAAAPRRSESGQGSLWTPSHPHCPQDPQDPPPIPSVSCSPSKEGRSVAPVCVALSGARVSPALLAEARCLHAPPFEKMVPFLSSHCMPLAC